ncbi:hypothetical protein Taro_045465 [Colocasia esculenta]|uniref:DYW domain-containing protein n=1 Tax=Colocasia esculenta TaxID=4460 RepID=A0A843WX50_COLES|nr:hypothetical protein [Colocasia esculenta]
MSSDLQDPRPPWPPPEPQQPSPTASRVAFAAVDDPARIHASLIKTAAGDRAFNHLIALYSRRPSTISDALRLFRRLPFPPNVVSWSALISAHSHDPAAAFRLFVSMLRSPTPPNQRTLATLLGTCASFPSVLSTAVAQVHSLSVKLSLSRLPFAGSALVTAYSKARRPLDALKAFDKIDEKDGVCYAAAVVGLAQNRRPTEALSLFTEMRAAAFESTMYSVSGALRAAAEAAALEQSRVIHAHAVVVGLESNLVVGTALVDAYGKSGLVSEAQRAFDDLQDDANVVAWNAILSAYAQQGQADPAVQVFEKMLSTGLKGDELTFLAILTACSNAGLVSETERWLTSMSAEHGMSPGLEHYTCLVGAKARVGQLEEAQRVALAMPFEPDAAVWRTLLSACVAHGEAGLGQAAGRRLLELDPQDDSAYVMLANVYTAAGRRDEVARLWTAMRERGVKKEGGRSWVEVRGEVHVFLAGDKRHPMAREIYAKVEELMGGIAKLGYVQEAAAAAEEGLWYHSERLAVAFGLVSGAAPQGKALRVVKNLRICGHCHRVFKFISRVIDRQIVVRDAHRYHRFEHGVCSCKDLW